MRGCDHRRPRAGVAARAGAHAARRAGRLRRAAQVLKNRRPPRAGALLAPLREDLTEWRHASGRPLPTIPVFPAASGGFWRATDWRNWRKRIYKPVAESVGLAGARPYDLRHAFASLLMHEG